MEGAVALAARARRRRLLERTSLQLSVSSSFFRSFRDQRFPLCPLWRSVSSVFRFSYY